MTSTRSLELATGHCFHCDLPVPAGLDLCVEIGGKARPMCCVGCQAVAQAIVNAGQESFYQHRTGYSGTGRELVPDFIKETTVYDHPAVQKSFVTHTAGSMSEAHLIIEGITCAACIWLNEQYLQQLDGVESVQINYATRRARVRWDDAKIHLSEILQAVTRIGYTAHPYDPYRQHAVVEKERKQHLRKLGVAGLLGMQVMMMAVALYSGAWSGMEAGFRDLFHWASLVLTTPVVLYSAQPFFLSAYRDLRRGRVGMDVPVSIAIAIAFVASAGATLRGVGEVYYDSVVMFVFLLLAVRYLEIGARKRATESLDAIALGTPAFATKIDPSGKQEIVPVAELCVDDVVLLRPGDTVPADGEVIQGCSSVNESLITGESIPVSRAVGDRLVGGSTNVESPLQMRVNQTGDDTVLSEILRLSERAQTEKPPVVRLADRAASWFVGVVLILAIVVAVSWYMIDPTRWLPITIAVLVVTCPCALSLATPAVITVATDRLARLGLLVTRGRALEALARSSHVIFDKTGTLTAGRLFLERVITFSDLSTEQCLQRAAALEQASEHPIATVLLSAAAELELPRVDDVTVEPGSGVRGLLGGQSYYIGTREYFRNQSGEVVPENSLQELEKTGGTVVYLGTGRQLLAGFILQDHVRESSRDLIQQLRQQGKRILLMSGDNEQAVRRVADVVGIQEIFWSQKPQDKLSRVQDMQKEGKVVAMVGDGVNDAPVLARAQVSIAMGSGAPLAAVNADMVLLTDQIGQLGAGFRLALFARHVIRQNLAWAIGYNLLALTAAAIGLVPPWAAAIGMSISSLLVVGNAMRLRRF